jgi:hypothetical protein
VRLESDGEVEDDVLLVVDEDEPVAFVGTELHALQNVGLIVERPLPETQLGLALDESREHVNVEVDRSEADSLRAVAAETE